MSTPLQAALRLPCGFILRNRLIKAAMSEALAENGLPGPMLQTLYSTWGRGALGLMISGNVMVDGAQLGEPGNMVLEAGRPLEPYRALARCAQQDGTPMWLQLNHPGRQAPRMTSKQPVAPSVVPVRIPGLFASPRALEEAEIHAIIDRFGESAALAKEAGFSGVQIHGAHGYLISQFLSAKTNLRDDRWGGDLQRRMSFLVEVYRSVRAAVGAEYPVGLKLNATDFQKGGFDEDQSIRVIQRMEAEGVDLLEITGGTYEKSLAGRHQPSARASTRRREAYFLEFAQKARRQTQMPLAATGGFRSRDAMEDALQCGALDVVGLARPVL